jgi:hypothetical protein
MWNILTRCNFYGSLEEEFFNSHACSQQLKLLARDNQANSSWQFRFRGDLLLGDREGIKGR